MLQCNCIEQYIPINKMIQIIIIHVMLTIYIEGLELKRTISTFFKKWAKCTFLVLSNHTLRVKSHCILYLVKDA